MRNRRSFVVEQKIFTVEFSKDVVEIGERSKAVQVSAVLEVPLAKWLMKKIKELIEDTLQLGFIGSRKGMKIDLALNVKKNMKGFFFPLLVFSSSFERGLKCFCFPNRTNLQGGSPC